MRQSVKDGEKLERLADQDCHLPTLFHRSSSDTLLSWVLALARSAAMVLGMARPSEPLGATPAALLVPGKVQRRPGQDKHNGHGHKSS